MIQEIKLILEKIKGVPGLAAQLADSADIIEDIGLDSLQMMEFMLEVESQLNLEIDFENNTLINYLFRVTPSPFGIE